MVNEQLESMIAKLKEARDRYAFELESAPEGKLYASKDQYGTRYYRIVKKRGKPKREGITKNKELMRALARKEYLARAIAKMDKNIELLEKARQRYDACSPGEITEVLSASYKSLPEDYFYDPIADVVTIFLDRDIGERIGSHAAWGEEEYEQDDFNPEGRTIVTSKGELMRSKSEVLIAEKLYEYGIPFRYEQPLRIDDMTMHPDFTFEGANGEPFYLEFCGMMDDEDYVRSFLRKRRIYEEAGICQWKNMIYVFASGNEMNMMLVEDIITDQVIPWL